MELGPYTYGSEFQARTLSSTSPNYSIRRLPGKDNCCNPFQRRQRSRHRHLLRLVRYMCGSDFQFRTIWCIRSKQPIRRSFGCRKSLQQTRSPNSMW